MSTTNGETATPTAAATREGTWARLGWVGEIVDRRISSLQELAVRDQSSGVAALARLRRAVGTQPGTVQDVLEYTLAPGLAPLDAGDEPTMAETAAHISMTLYAVHQQSQRERMYRRGYGLGRSVRLLNGPEVDGERPSPVRRRFNALATADSLDELVHHTRGMVQLLRGKSIPLDYALLADQLTRWQNAPDGPSRVRRIWGREFFRTPTPLDQTDPSSREGD
jgi:CRISPR system Cascade subunit CasB